MGGWALQQRCLFWEAPLFGAVVAGYLTGWSGRSVGVPGQRLNGLAANEATTNNSTRRESIRAKLNAASGARVVTYGLVAIALPLPSRADPYLL